MLKWLFILFLPFTTLAQLDNQLWVDFNIDVKFNKKLSFVSDVGYRHQEDPSMWNQFVVRPGVSYNLGNGWKLTGGVGYFDKDFVGYGRDREIRLYQGLVYTTLLTHWLFIKNYLRAEQRFHFDNGTLPYETRFRNQLEVRFYIVNKIKHSFYIPLSVELFGSFASSSENKLVGWERYRAYTGFAYQKSDLWKIEFQINTQNYDPFEILDESSNNDLFLRIRYHLYLHRKKGLNTQENSQ